MRRMLLNLAVACSLALCLATFVFWLRSYTSADAVGHAGQYRAGEVSFINGRLHVWVWATGDPSWAGRAWWSGWRYAAPSATNSWAYRLAGGTVTSSFGFAGTSFLRQSLPRGAFGADTIWHFHTPAWALVLAAAVPPAWWACRWHRERTARARELGLCPSCGYDLRATPDRCPECGAVPDVPPHIQPMQRTATAASGTRQ
jgi:hypothetical protein